MLEKEFVQNHDRDEIGIPRLLSPKEVADVLGISVKTVNKLVRQGKLGCVQVTARDRRFSEHHVREFIDSRTLPRHVDTPSASQVSSPARKGGERDRKATSFEAQVTGSLVEELKAQCH